ncbi:MAG TPA: hypothetical protein PK520_00435 [Exilispira sp.]|nr:hypothetical protein [Exilispira sp.]HQQ18538.1 hypothetical protein [Exilispira sp.]
MDKTIFKLIGFNLKQLLHVQFEGLFSNKNNKTKNSKKVISRILMICLLIYAFLVIGGSWGVLCNSIFKYLSLNDKADIQIDGQSVRFDEYIVLIISFFFIMIFLISFLFTFLSISSYLSLSGTEEYFLTLPIKSTTFFASKVIYLTLVNTIYSMLLSIITLSVYGFHFKVSFDYYIIYLIISVCLNLFAVMISIPISLLLIRLFKFLKNKDTMAYLSIFIILPLVIGYNIFQQNIMQNISDPSMLNNFAVSIASITYSLSKSILSPIIFFIVFLARLASGSFGLFRYLYLIFSILLVTFIFYIIVVLFSRMYVSILTMTNRSRKTSFNLKRNSNYKQKPIYLTIFKKENLSIFREPSFFLNGPFVILLLPLIIGLSIFVQLNTSKGLDNVLSSLKQMPEIYYIYISVLASFILSSFASISSTSISREGKSFSIIKSLPIDPLQYFKGKISHALFFSFICILVINIPLYFIFPKIELLLFSALVSLLFSFIFHLISISIDLLNPKLSWENPVQAVKQNMNAVYSILIGLLFSVLFFFQMKIFLADIPTKIFAKFTKMPYDSNNIFYTLMRRTLFLANGTIRTDYIFCAGLFILLVIASLELVVIILALKNYFKSRFYKIES